MSSDLAPIDVVLAGGIRHQDVYARYLAAIDGVNIVGLTDEGGLPDYQRERNARVAVALSLPLLELDRAVSMADAACIGSEQTRHVGLARRFLADGRHVLIDKPARPSGDDAAGWGERPGVVATYVHRLFSPQVRRLKASIESGSIGVPRALAIDWIVGGGLDPGDDEVPAILSPALSGGGEVMNFLGYSLDYVEWLTGLRVVAVFASAVSLDEIHRAYGVEDVAAVTLLLEREVSATIVVGRSAAPIPGGGLHRLTITGSHGTARVDEERPLVVAHLSDREATPPAIGIGADAALAGLFADFVESIREGRRPLRTLVDGARVAGIIAATYESIETGRLVPLAERLEG